ncbi:uncharacterized protein si:ch211-227n13.3 [Triplophysa dalaica]|uniref:uncharacterized protein si:ch211-227n13.3 n=1 Tax=Triplophysa dalaica TaxID=1582913 RepID=UPI0024DF780F|nr:uncharacterized protein si:ch211-227n13.3 [Triplophysa dalaica]
MDVTEETNYGYFKRKEWYQYLVNFPQRTESGCCREVNVLVISEVTARSVSMKLRRTSVLKRRQQTDLKEGESNRVSRHGSIGKKATSTRTETSSVLLSSDTDPCQSDGNIIDLTVGNRKGIEQGETRAIVKSQGNSSGMCQKISLASSAMAEDTLGKLRVMNNTNVPEARSSNPLVSEREDVEECVPALDEFSAEFTVESGPSSPNLDVNTAKCRECERLFSKMRRQTPSKTKNRDKNPASLSCDHWVLLKKWHPQRGRHRKRGLLWTSLSQIRKLPVHGYDSAERNRTQTFCSRPHVFQKRNLRRCKYLASIQTDPSLTKVKPRQRKKHRAALWPNISGTKPAKRKPSMNNTLSQQRFSPKLSISIRHKDKPQPNDSSRLDTSLRQKSKQKRKDFQDRSDKQEACDGIEGTRRVLKFDDMPEVVAVDTAEQSRGPQRQLESGEICEAQNCVETKDSDGLQEELFEDSDDFKTPSDLFSLNPKIKRGGQKTVPVSGETKPTKTSSTANFRSMLATMVKNQNKIIKETFQ